MTHWQTLLSDRPLTPPESIASDQAAIAILSDYSLLTIKGEDAVKFLQGQCTCDFNLLAQQQWLLGAHCNVQGRMHSSFLAAQLNDNTIALRLHSSIAESALNALKKYSVFSKVELQLQPAWIIGLNQVTTSHTLPQPEIGCFSSSLENTCLVRLNNTRSELWITAEDTAAQLLDHLTHEQWMTTQDYWQRLNIINGQGEVRAESAEALLPQELNFQLINGISFNKGCYTGQEIIARLHYKASLKKHLYHAQISGPISEPLPPYGTDVIAAGSGKRAGKVIHSARDSSENIHLLVLANDDLVASDNAAIELTSQVKLTWLPLPYAIP